MTKKREDAQMLSRRGFLNSAFGAGLALTTAQEAPAQTPAVQPARKRLIVDAQVHLWKAEPGMLGVRVTFLGPAAAWLTDGTADWFWPAAEKARLPVMFLSPGRASEFARIAEHHPQLTLIVDHMGVNLDLVKAGKLGNAIEQTTSLAKYPNVSVKLSAAPNYSTETYPFRDFTPHIRRLFDAY